VAANVSAIRFDLRAMTEDDLAAAQGLSREVKWPHRVEDWRFVLKVGQGLVAHAGDRLLGTAMWWSYGKTVARIGMIIVDPSLHRSGIGGALMDAVLGGIDAPTLFLNATTAGEPLYRRLGFSGIGSIVQHQGASFDAPIVPMREGERIRPLGRGDAERLVELDALAGGVRRDAVLAALTGEAEAVVLDHDGTTVGFAFYRRFGRGHVIGPVIARDTAGAKALVAHWIGSNPGMFMRIDVPGESGLSEWLDELGLARVSPALTMRRGPALASDSQFHAFGLVNQALG
jgi:GNAT superfamily N-acetyltransferase